MVNPLYDICDLSISSTMVFFQINGNQVAGFVRFTPSGIPRYHVGSLRRSDKIDITPEAWRPVDPNAWPVALPEPLKETPTAVHTEPSPVDEPYDQSVRLGRPGAPPESPEEVKARIIRFIWTREVDLDDDNTSNQEIAWPKDLRIESKVREKMFRAANGRDIPGWREGDYDDFHIPEFLPPVREQFKPTPRDVSDYNHKDGPRAWRWYVPEVFKLRAKRRTFPQISELMKVPEDVVVGWLDDACERIYRERK